MKTILSLAGLLIAAVTLTAQNSPVPPIERHDPQAERLLKAVVDKLASAQSVLVDAQLPVENDQGINNIPNAPFRRNFELALTRPYSYRVDRISGAITETWTAVRVADGKTIWSPDLVNHIAYKQPLHPEDFYRGITPLVQYFFTTKLDFDPADPQWRQAVSLYANSKAAYDKFVTIKCLGERKTIDGPVQLVEMTFRPNSEDLGVRQVFSLQNDMILQVETYEHRSLLNCAKYRNYRFDAQIPHERFAYTPPADLPVQNADPVRLGAAAPEFELPTTTGASVTLKELLKKKKALLVCTLLLTYDDFCVTSPDIHLSKMKKLQEIREKFGAQGLEVIAIAGGEKITPDMKDEVMRNMLPVLTRFSYPVAMDLDLERGIQGSAYKNFQLDGRNCVLLDSEGRVVFACDNLIGSNINEIALYQALASIGFVVAPIDLELKR